MKRALIFGVGGFVGPYLADELRQNGYEVWGSDIIDCCIPDVQVIKADLQCAEEVQRLLERVKPDIVINLAAVSSVGYSWKAPQTTIAVNVIGALNILEAVRRLSPMPKVLFVGSSEEYAVFTEPISEDVPLEASNPYGISKMTQKRFAEIYRRQFGMQIYYVCPFNHTGVGQRDSFVIPSWCKQVAAITKGGKPGTLTVGNVSVKRDFSHVKDVVRAYRMILESGDCETVYNVGSGTAFALAEILEHVISLSDQPITVEVDQNLIRPSDNSIICCDHTLITQKLGWQPEYTVLDAVSELYHHYLQDKQA